MTDNNNANAIQ